MTAHPQQEQVRDRHAGVPDIGESLIWALLERLSMRHEVIGLVEPEDFRKHIQGRAFAAITECEHDDVSLLINEASNRGESDLAGYLFDAWGDPRQGGSPVLAPQYARALRAQAVQKRVAEISEVEARVLRGGTGKLHDGTHLDPSMGTAEIESLCEAARRSLRSGSLDGVWTHVGDAASAALEEAQRRQQGETEAFGTGLRDLDEQLCGGFESGDFVVLAGTPGAGKTALGLHIAEHLAGAKGEPGAIVSMEMGSPQLAARLLSSCTGVQGSQLRSGDLTTEDWHHLEAARDMFREWPIRICDLASLTAARIDAAVRPLAQRGELRWLIVDYLTLLGKPGAKMSVQEAVNANARGLKELARKYSIPVICLAQLNKAGVQKSRSGKDPDGSDLRDSSGIEEAADVIIIAKRGEGECETNLIIAKQRNGPKGTVTVDFLPHVMRFQDRELL